MATKKKRGTVTPDKKLMGIILDRHRQVDMPPKKKKRPTKKQDPMLSADAARASMDGLGFTRITHMKDGSFKDCKTIVIVPTRKMVHKRVVERWQNLIAPMNEARAFFLVEGHEVADAYNKAVQQILDDPGYSRFKYILTLEDDNLPPPDAHVRLLESINELKLDAVSGLYYTKGEINMPQAYGDPTQFAVWGDLEFRPRPASVISAATQQGGVVPVNGIAMGCALWRLQMFKDLPGPWFKTMSDVVNGQPVGHTQDLYFCRRAVLAGKRFGVDCRVKVGHLDINTGEVY